MTEQTKAEAGAKLAEALALMEEATPGRCTIAYETNIMAGDGYSATSVQSNFMDAGVRNAANAAALVSAFNLLRDHGEFLQAAAESHARALIGASEVQS